MDSADTFMCRLLQGGGATAHPQSPQVKWMVGHTQARLAQLSELAFLPAFVLFDRGLLQKPGNAFLKKFSGLVLVPGNDLACVSISASARAALY